MRFCNTCHIKYETPLKHCIFCNNTLESLHPTDADMIEWNYPAYQKIHHRRRIFLKLLTFLVFVTNLICIFINQRTSEGQLSWSLYVVASTVYALLLFISITKRGRFIKKVIQNVLLTDALLLALGTISGSYHWCIDYVLPISIMVLNLYAVCHLFGKKQRMYDYSIYVINLSVLGLLIGILLYVNLVSSPWASITCIIYSSVTLIALFLFSPKATWEELRRRLHFQIIHEDFIFR